MTRIIVLAAGSLALAAPVSAQQPAAQVAATTMTDAVIAREAAAKLAPAYPADGPGAAVIMTRNGRTVFAGARGLADIADARALDADTPIRVGSITKQFTAALVLQLVAEGKLALDDPLGKFLPDFPAPTRDATVRQLLDHTSGVFDFSKIPAWMGSAQSLRPNTTADLVALMREQPAKAAPGAEWEYNNGGYVLLGAIVEAVEGAPWSDVLERRITRPLGLDTLERADAARADAATGYSLDDGKAVPAQGVHISVAHASGALRMSVADLARWNHSLHHGKVVPPALYREMTSPAKLADGSTRPYGFGLRLQRIRGMAALVHGGSGRGLDAEAIYIPEADLTVAVLANSDEPQTDPDALARRLAAMALGQPLPQFERQAVVAATVAPLFGVYTPPDGPEVRFLARDGKYVFGVGDSEREVLAAGGDRFFAPSGLAWLEFARDAAGSPTMAMHSAEDREPDLATRTGDIPADHAVPKALLESYVGIYQTEGPSVLVALADDGTLTIAVAGQPPERLRAVSDAEFHFETSPVRAVFHPECGRTETVTLYRGARELHGKRVPGASR